MNLLCDIPVRVEGVVSIYNGILVVCFLQGDDKAFVVVDSLKVETRRESIQVYSDRRLTKHTPDNLPHPSYSVAGSIIDCQYISTAST
jgi:hypothetical protein